MIISHRHRFIFIKTMKTAGTSIEVFLSPHCDEGDVVTPIYPPVEGHQPRNYTGLWNPTREFLCNTNAGRRRCLSELSERRRFYNHIPAMRVRYRVPRRIWNSYFKFCVERNPFDKTLSHYHMLNRRSGGQLTFDQYLHSSRLCRNIPRYTDRHGKLIVDHVVRYEALTDELATIFDQLGIPFQGTLGARAKGQYRTDRSPYQSVITPSQREIIAHVFDDEIRMHGYRFD